MTEDRKISQAISNPIENSTTVIGEVITELHQIKRQAKEQWKFKRIELEKALINIHYTNSVSDSRDILRIRSNAFKVLRLDILASFLLGYFRGIEVF